MFTEGAESPEKGHSLFLIGREDQNRFHGGNNICPRPWKRVGIWPGSRVGRPGGSGGKGVAKGMKVRVMEARCRAMAMQIGLTLKSSKEQLWGTLIPFPQTSR